MQAALEASQLAPPPPPPTLPPSYVASPSTGSSRPASAGGGAPSYTSNSRPFAYDASYMANSVDSPSGTLDTVAGELARGFDHWSGPQGHPRPTLGDLDSSYDSQKGGEQQKSSSSSWRGGGARAAPVREEEEDDDEVVPASDGEEPGSEYKFHSARIVEGGIDIVGAGF